MRDEDVGTGESSWPVILFVDDQESQQRLLMLLAHKLSYSMHVVSSAKEALEAVSTYDFDAILMDVRMPHVDGIQCTKEIRYLEKKKERHTPIIALTACVMPGDRERCLAAGMDDYLSKPFSIDQLADKLKAWTRS